MQRDAVAEGAFGDVHLRHFERVRGKVDRIDGRASQLTRLRMVNTLPTPFPPEPLRWVVVQLTRWSLARSDARGGRRNIWLRLLDALGLGFDS